MVVAKMRSAHVPMKILRLQVNRKDISQKMFQLSADRGTCLDLVATRKRYGYTRLAEHCSARGDLHVDRCVLGTLAGTNPLRKVAEQVARPNVCTRHEHTLNTRDFDHLERIGCVLDGDPAFVKQSGKAAVSIAVRGTPSSVPPGDGLCIAVLFSSPVSQYRYSFSLRIPPRNQASPI